MTDHDDALLDHDADARIDALARAAGSELRRPAPADGLARAHRARRNRQVTRLAVAGTAVVALTVVGAVIIRSGDGDRRVVPADTTTLDTEPSPVTTAPAPTVTTEPSLPSNTAAPTTDAPTTTVAPSTTLPDPAAVGAPDVVYTSAEFFGATVDQTLVDPNEGSPIRTEPTNWEVSRAAQDALLGRSSLDGRVDEPAGPGVISYRFEVGGISYSYVALPSEIPSLDLQDPEALPLFDRCGQSALTVEGVASTTLPARVRRVAVSADRRYVATVSSVCPESDTLADAEIFSSPSSTSVQVFDATHPERAAVLTVDDAGEYLGDGEPSFSANGRFVWFGSRFFDLDAEGEPREVAVTPGCSGLGTMWSRFIGPWIGESSVAVLSTCDNVASLVIQDLMPGGGRVEVAFPTGAIPNSWNADVDHAHYDRPETAWFTLCDDTVATCWVGQGSGPLTVLPGVKQASFLPLGFTYGG